MLKTNYYKLQPQFLTHMMTPKETYTPPLISIHEVVVEQGFVISPESEGQFTPPSWAEEPF